VHHFLVHICTLDNSTDNLVNKYKNPTICSSPLGAINQGCSGLAYAWAVGGGPLVIPPEAGLRMGKQPGAIKYLVLEIHYNNPDVIQGATDASGVILTYTPEIRKYDSATIVFGDILVSEYPIPGQSDGYKVEANCPSECTSRWSNDIIVFADFLHMHEHGKSMWSTQWRDGNRLPGFVNRIEYWDFNFQQITPVQHVIKRGDRINTHCTYNTMDIPKTKSVRFGSASSDEMCMEFVSYYPKLTMPGKGDIYGFCGKLRGVASYRPDTGLSWDFSTGEFATVCGNLKGLETMLWNNNKTVSNPTIADPPGEEARQFGVPPATCNVK